MVFIYRNHRFLEGYFQRLSGFEGCLAKIGSKSMALPRFSKFLGLALCAFFLFNGCACEEREWNRADAQGTEEAYEAFLKEHPDSPFGEKALKALWRLTTEQKTIEAYEKFIKAYPNSPFVEQASEEIWNLTAGQNSVEGFERYLSLYGEGKHVSEAKDKIDSLRWREAAAANTIRSYQNYLSTHPEGEFAEQAAKKISALRKDRGPYKSTFQADNESVLNNFLTDFPGHQKEAEVRRVLSDWKKAVESNSAKGFKSFLSRHRNYSSLAEKKIRSLMASVDCKTKKQNYYLLHGLVSKELKKELKRRYGDCINASHFCDYCGEPAIGWCHMRNQWVCETHRYFTQGGVRWRCP